MECYDPHVPPAPAAWLALDEAERIALVTEFHRRARIRLPNAQMHAAFHATIENQLAMGDEIPVGGTLDRLMVDGLDRHEAIHAIASVLSAHMANVVGGKAGLSDPNTLYYAALDRLTAKTWRES